jgi:plasmid maintenance system antidote protein VapI
MKLTERNQEIVRRARLGEAQQALADEFGLTRARIGQIVHGANDQRYGGDVVRIRFTAALADDLRDLAQHMTISQYVRMVVEAHVRQMGELKDEVKNAKSQ